MDTSKGLLEAARERIEGTSLTATERDMLAKAYLGQQTFPNRNIAPGALMTSGGETSMTRDLVFCATSSRRQTYDLAQISQKLLRNQESFLRKAARRLDRLESMTDALDWKDENDWDQVYREEFSNLKRLDLEYGFVDPKTGAQLDTDDMLDIKRGFGATLPIDSRTLYAPTVMVVEEQSDYGKGSLDRTVWSHKDSVRLTLLLDFRVRVLLNELHYEELSPGRLLIEDLTLVRPNGNEDGISFQKIERQNRVALSFDEVETQYIKIYFRLNAPSRRTVVTTGIDDVENYLRNNDTASDKEVNEFVFRIGEIAALLLKSKPLGFIATRPIKIGPGVVELNTDWEQQDDLLVEYYVDGKTVTPIPQGDEHKEVVMTSLRDMPLSFLPDFRGQLNAKPIRKATHSGSTVRIYTALTASNGTQIKFWGSNRYATGDTVTVTNTGAGWLEFTGNSSWAFTENRIDKPYVYLVSEEANLMIVERNGATLNLGTGYVYSYDGTTWLSTWDASGRYEDFWKRAIAGELKIRILNPVLEALYTVHYPVAEDQKLSKTVEMISGKITTSEEKARIIMLMRSSVYYPYRRRVSYFQVGSTWK